MFLIIYMLFSFGNWWWHFLFEKHGHIVIFTYTVPNCNLKTDFIFLIHLCVLHGTTNQGLSLSRELCMKLIVIPLHIFPDPFLLHLSRYYRRLTMHFPVFLFSNFHFYLSTFLHTIRSVYQFLLFSSLRQVLPSHFHSPLGHGHEDLWQWRQLVCSSVVVENVGKKIFIQPPSPFQN